MNKLLVALCATAFAWSSASVLADDSSVKPISKMETQEAKAARADAKALPTFDLAAASARSEARRNARLEALYDECSVDPSASPECTQFECDDDDALEGIDDFINSLSISKDLKK